jgi:xanthine dehydrogenase accessory factor
MVVRSDGSHLGTVGGGCGEAQVIAAGLTALDDGRARVVHVDLTDAVTTESDAACGGAMEVVVVPGGGELLPLVHALGASPSERGGVAVVTCLAPPRRLGSMVVVGSGGPLACVGMEHREAASLWASLMSAGRPAPTVTPGAGRRPQLVEIPLTGEISSVLWEEVLPRRRLLVCGGGHIAVALSHLGRLLDWEVIVLDDREAFANRVRFPHADRVLCGPFWQGLTELVVDMNTFAVVVTRGHRDDLECVRNLLGRRPGYLGMIGSRRRVAGVRKLLVEEGFDQSSLGRLHAPIGLDIGAETPEEIAVAIMAELIMVGRGGTGRPLKLPDRGMEGIRA